MFPISRLSPSSPPFLIALFLRCCSAPCPILFRAKLLFTLFSFPAISVDTPAAKLGGVASFCPWAGAYSLREPASCADGRCYNTLSFARHQVFSPLIPHDRLSRALTRNVAPSMRMCSSTMSCTSRCLCTVSSTASVRGLSVFSFLPISLRF